MIRMRLTLRTRRGAGKRAFTLVELLVAVGVVSFLIVGIGQIFRSVGGLVSVGSAVTEVEQMARAIERQLRDDFAALSAMRSEDTFIAIRMREAGDINRNGSLDPNERAIYLTMEDRDADIRDIGDGLFNAPYEDGSRAVTVRLDELMFLAEAPIGGTYTSFEQSRYGNTVASAPSARIYYGHMLRPPSDPNWPPDDAANNPPRVPQRMFIPDGDFGEGVPDGGALTDPNRYAVMLNSFYGNSADFADATGRNEYASEWLLGRQALLLAGGTAAGNSESAFSPTVFENEREYAPFIRDLETLDRFWGVNGGGYGYDLDFQGPRSGIINQFSDIYEPPGMRLIHHGRTDMVAQTLTDVRRWLEGEPWPSGSSPTTPPEFANQRSYAISDGRFGIGAFSDPYLSWSSNAIPDNEFGSFSATNFVPTVRGLLWQRPEPGLTNDQSYYLTRRGVRSAIAGAFTRILADDQPAHFDRIRDTAGINYEIVNFEAPSDSEDVYMDAHAILANQCSNFEIAWRLADPDWPVAQEDIDINNDGTPEFRPGDRVWIDITPLDPDNEFTTRSTVQRWLNTLDPNGQLTGQPPSFGATPTASNNFAPFFGADATQQPEVGYEEWRGMPQGYGRYFSNTVVQPTQTRHPFFASSADEGFPPPYNQEISGGAPENTPEYLAIWPFRTPSLSGGFTDEAFPKKLQFRVRMTLHDTQNRIKGGRTFEYVFDVAPQE